MKQRLLGGHALKFLEKVVIFCFERRYPQKYIVARLKSNVLAPRNFLDLPKKLAWLRHCVTVTLHHLSKMSEVNSHMRKSALTIVT